MTPRKQSADSRRRCFLEPQSKQLSGNTVYREDLHIKQTDPDTYSEKPCQINVQVFPCLIFGEVILFFMLWKCSRAVTLVSSLINILSLKL
jgi:hypothetical protein